MLDLVEGGQTWDEVVELAHGLEEAGAPMINTGIGWHEARVPTIVTSVPRGAFAWTDRAAEGRGVRPGLRLQPDQHPRGRRADARRAARPTWCRWPGRSWPTPTSSPRPRPAAPTRSTPASPATRPASTTRSRNQMASCLVNPRACHETELVLLPTRRPERVAVVGAGPGRARRRGVGGRARARGDAVRGGRRRSAASSGSRWRIPGKEEFAETLRYFRRRLEVLGVDVRLGSDADRGRTSRRSTRSWSPPASCRALPDIPGIDHPKRRRPTSTC